MKKIDNIYDKMFKVIFSDRKNTKDFLKIYLPEELKRYIDFRSITVDPNEYIDEEMKGEYSDIVIRSKLVGKDNIGVDIYILYEHKSYKDKRIFIQLLSYMIAMWKKDFDEKKQPRIVVPLVFYHGKKRWDIPEEFHGQFKVDNDIKKYLLNFRYILFNTINHDFDPEEILEFKQNVALYTALMLFKDTVEKNIKIINKIFDFWGKNDFIENGDLIKGKAFYFLLFITRTRDIPLKKLGKMLEDSNIKGDNLMPTLADRLRDEGIKIGKKEGIEIGKIEGKIEGEKEGKMSAKIETVKTMLELGYSIKNIAAVTKLSIEKIREIERGVK